MSRAYRSAGLARSLALLWTFLLATAAILAVGAIVLSSVLSRNLEQETLSVNARHVAVYTDSVLAPVLVRGGKVNIGEAALRRLGAAVRARADVTGVSVWSRKGHLLASTYRRSPSAKAADQVSRVLGGEGAQVALTDVATRPGGSQRSRRQIVVWAPLRAVQGRRPLGVAEVTIAPRALDASIGDAKRTIWIAVAFVFVVLALALALLVRGASARLSRQNDAFHERTRELLESTQLLEESLLQTVETLNAAVEARDPYTAGHSQRVRRVSLAVGRTLALPSKRLGTLGTAALFHDVGKIGIPDSILTKAGPLAPVEAAIMREHVTRGAEIVSKVSSFQDAVPVIRHHHERWDGLGYPDGLSAEEIPLEAAIIGLADAWDAMTTDRPYKKALSLNDALMQIRSGRGKQFSPSVVDAFTEVVRRRPAEVMPPGASGQGALAG
jgi:putative nucleotidyltransferase with HDIG domain